MDCRTRCKGVLCSGVLFWALLRAAPRLAAPQGIYRGIAQCIREWCTVHCSLAVLALHSVMFLIFFFCPISTTLWYYPPPLPMWNVVTPRCTRFHRNTQYPPHDVAHTHTHTYYIRTQLTTHSHTHTHPGGVLYYCSIVQCVNLFYAVYVKRNALYI